MLTEQEITRSWNKLLGTHEYDDETLGKAELLLAELRPESPLRHRLATELRELRRLHAQRKG